MDIGGGFVVSGVWHTPRMRTLTDLENRILDFAVKYPQPAQVRSLIIETFGWRSAAYVQKLNRILDDPAAAFHRPMDVHRLRRVRDEAVARRRVS